MEPARQRQLCACGERTLIVFIVALAALASYAPSAIAAEADLVIESVTHSPTTPARGDTVTFTVTVRNQGDAHADDFSTKLYFDSATEPTTSGSGNARVTIYDLPAGAAKAIEFELAAPLDAGTFKAWAYTDYIEVVAESDEGNNAGPTGGHGWTVAASADPDLFIASMTSSPSASTPGDTVTFTVTVTNIGGSDAGAFNVGFWSDPSAAPDIDDVPDDEFDVPGLAAGASTSLNFPLTAPGAGQYRAYAYADRRSGGEVTESVEANNVADDYWDVISPDAYESDDDSASATPISDGDTQVHSIHVAGDEDYLTFDLAAVGSVVVTLSNTAPVLLVEAILYSELLAPIDGSNMDGLLYSSEVPPGTYYLKVDSRFSSYLVDEYTLGLAIIEGDAYEPDDSFAQASVITPGVMQNHTTHYSDDDDYVQFTLSGAADVVIEANGVSEAMRLTFQDSTHAYLGSASRLGGSLRIERTALPAGTYYAHVYSPWGSWVPPYDYTLTVTTSTPAKPDLVIEATTYDPSPAVPGQSVTFTATVTNIGGVDAGAFNVGFWSDESPSPDLISIPEQNTDVSSLAAGASVNLLFEVTAPALGRYSAYVYADRRDGSSEIDETSELNNRGVCYWNATVTDAYEPDDSFPQATTILPGEIQTHSIHVVGDQDYFTFALSAAGFVEISLDEGPSYAYVHLYDSLMTLLDSSNSDLELGLLEAGTYYMMVEDQGNNGIIARYDIELVLNGDAYEPDNSFAEATPITVGNPQAHSISPDDDRDFVVFTLAEASDISIEATEQFRDVALYLYDTSLMEIAYDRYAGGIARHGLGAGTYYVMATNNSSTWSGSPYVLNLTASTTLKPDLAFVSTSLSSYDAAPGDTVTFTATVVNQGSVDAGAFSVGFWSDWPVGSSPDVTDIPEEKAGVSGLLAGETATLTFTITAPASGGPWAFFYVDCGPWTSDVSESNEDNNLEYIGWGVYAPDAYENDDTFADAKTIVVGDIQTHSLHVTGDKDYVTFTLSETADVSIVMTLIDNLPPWEMLQVYLFDTSKSLLGSNAEAGGPRPPYDVLPFNAYNLAAGTYYVKVNYSDSMRLVVEYELSIAALTPDAYETDNCFADASTITMGETQLRSIHAPQDKDYVRFILEQTSNVVISVEGGGVYGILYGPGGTQLDWPHTSTALEPGTYYVRIMPGFYDAVAPAYTLTLADGTETPTTDGCASNGGGGGALCWFACFALAFFVASRRRSRALRF